MKACVVQELSGPTGLVYTDVDDITGNDDTIIVDVRAAGVCFPDLLLSKGEYQLKLPPPFIPGMEAAGVVHWAPEDSEFKVGDRVSAFGVLGGYAEQVIVPLANVIHSPAELDDAEAVSLLVNYNTMYFALARRAAMRAGDSVLVLGSAGGVGTAAIQVARAMGASKVIALLHRTSAMEFVESLGADVVLPLTDGWAQAVRDHTDGRGVDIIVDPVGGSAFDDAIRVLAIDGKLLVIGFAAGAIPTVKVNRLLLRNIGVLGVAWGEYLHQVPGSAALFAWGLNQLVSAGLKPPPPQRYPLSEGSAALQALADGGCSASSCWSLKTDPRSRPRSV
jgi:NADPH:quinone reductase